MDKTRIMVVEDEGIIAHDIARQLTEMGHDVVAILNSGEDAVEKVGELHPDLVLMDIMLAGAMDGVEAADQIRFRWDIPVVFLTAYADMKWLQRAKLVYPSGYVLKPFEYDALKIAIEMSIYISIADRERKRTEEALRKSEQKFRDLVERINDVFYELDNMGIIQYASPSIERMFGYSQSEAIGRSILDVLDPGHTAMAIENIQKVMHGDIASREYCARRRSGEICWIQVSSSPVMKGDEAVGISGVMSDITERKLAEKVLFETMEHLESLVRNRTLELEQKNAELQESSERYRSLYNNTPVMLHSIDPNGNLVSVSDYWLKTLGYVREEVIGQKYYEFLTEASRNHAVSNILPEYVKRGYCQNVEYQFVKKNGEVIETLLSAISEMDSNGVVARSLSVVIDITERKRAEEELQGQFHLLQQLLDAIPIPIFYKDRQGIYLGCNAGYEKWLGMARESVVGKTVFDIAPEELADIYKQADEALFAHPGEQVYETSFAHADGSRRDIIFHKATYVGTDGYVAGVVGVILDITERKRAENALAHSYHLMRYIIEHNRSAIAVHDKDLKYLYVSRRYLEEYKVKEKDVIGKHHYEVFPDLPQKWRDVHQKALSGEISSAEDDPYEREDGTVDWTRWQCRPWYESDGSIGGIIVYTEVITST